MRAACCVLRAAWIVAGMVLLAVSPPRRLSAQTPIVTTQRSVPLAADGYVRVMNGAGSIHVTGWERDSVQWSGHHRADQQLFGGGSPRMVKVGVGGEEAPVRLVVRVPHGAKLVIDAGEASVDVDGMTGPVEIRGGGGAVHLAGTPVRVTIETADGDVTLERGTFRSTEIRTAGGDIRVTGGREEVVLTTVTGEVMAELVGVTRGNLSSVTGAVRMRGSVDPTGTLSVESHGGDVTIALERGTGVELVATAFGGTIVNTLTSSAPRPVRDGRSQLLETTIGNGGGTVTVTAFKGTVRLQPK